MKVGYIRVSSTDQNTARQLDGLSIEKVFTDKLSGRTALRPALQEMLSFVRGGDEIFVHSIDRLARNLIDLRSIVQELTGKGVSITFVKEALTFSSSENPTNTLMLNMLGSFAEFERAMISSRQREGIAAAKKRGKHLGRPSSLSRDQVTQLMAKVKSGANKVELSKEFGISRATLYKTIKAASPTFE